MPSDSDIPLPALARRRFDRAAAGYDAAAVLAHRVRDEMLERLGAVRAVPTSILDLGAGTGQGAAALKARFRKARVVAADFSPGMLEHARRRSRWRRRFATVCADAAQMPFADGEFDLVFCNLMIPSVPDPDAVFGEIRRVLAPRGLLALSTLGPDTLRELRTAWAAVDKCSHVHRFIDMHDIGDALMRAGLAEPVMDVDRYTLTYDTLAALMADLRNTGAANATRGRPRGLTSPARMAAVEARYEAFRRDGRLPATCEVVFGHAWAPDRPAHPAGEPGVTEIPVSQIGRRRDR